MVRFPTGGRIRQQRRKSRLTQAELADAVGISTSYLNLIENEKRPIGGALLNRIASALDVVPAHLSGNENLRLTQELLELIRTYPDTQMDEGQALQLIAASSDWARAFLQLHRRYREASETATALSDRLGLTPKAMRMLLWEVQADEVAKRRAPTTSARGRIAAV